MHSYNKCFSYFLGRYYFAHFTFEGTEPQRLICHMPNKWQSHYSKLGSDSKACAFSTLSIIINIIMLSVCVHMHKKMDTHDVSLGILMTVFLVFVFL